MMAPVLENYGLCIFRGDCFEPELAYHSGWNEGFLTNWRFSLEDDICTAVMINRSNVPTSKALNEVGKALYESLK